MNLVGKAEKILPKEGQWRVFFLGFARQGWTADARTFADNLKASKIGGENWQATGMLLRTLDQVDAELEAWTV
jgi:hypothetical protein